MAIDLFTAGQTSGITQLPAQTIRRYVSDFSEYFSEGAKIPTKGRRYTKQDIKNLLLIRNLKSSHTKNEKIKAALQSNSQPVSEGNYDDMNALKIVSYARAQNAETKQLITECIQISRQAMRTIAEAKYITDRFSKSLELREETPMLKIALTEQTAKLQKIIDEWNFSQMNKGFLSRLLGL